jgi:hypothetical protein
MFPSYQRVADKELSKPCLGLIEGVCPAPSKPLVLCKIAVSDVAESKASPPEIHVNPDSLAHLRVTMHPLPARARHRVHSRTPAIKKGVPP